MEKSTPIGLVLGFVLIFGSIFMGTGWATFFDVPSLVLTLGGTIAAAVVAHSFTELGEVPKLILGMFKFETPDLQQRIADMTDFARIARRDGLLALDRKMEEVSHPFVRFGLEMAVDGIDESEIDVLMRDRIGGEARARSLGPRLFNNLGSYAPAFGMIGTLIGLIQMMQNLADPTQIGAGMAVAMVTTFYGALLANLIFLPVAVKLKTQSGLALQEQELIRAGILGIVRGESPSMVEKRLGLFLKDEKAAKTATEPAPLARAA